jgi:hypothetical protein
LPGKRLKNDFVSGIAWPKAIVRETLTDAFELFQFGGALL